MEETELKTLEFKGKNIKGKCLKLETEDENVIYEA